LNSKPNANVLVQDVRIETYHVSTLRNPSSCNNAAANAQKLMGFPGDRLGGKPIELAVEANGKKLTVKAHSREELEDVWKYGEGKKS
jgi:hypothetical protein